MFGSGGVRAGGVFNDPGRFADYATGDLAAQCRMQARENLDPEYRQFMIAVADRLEALATPHINPPEAVA